MFSIRAFGSMWKLNESASSLTPLLRRVVVQEHGLLRRLLGEHDVLGDGHDRDQHEVLVHHPDPAADRVLRRAEADGLALEQDLALVGL